MEKNERRSGLPLPAGKRRKVRVWLIVPAAVAGVVAITAFLILGMPRDYRKEVMNETPDPGLFLSIQQKLADAMLTPDGVAERAEIALSAEELNACLNAGLKMAQLKPKEGDPSFNGSWRDGLLELRVSQPLGFLAVNAELRATPGVRDGKPELTVHSARRQGACRACRNRGFQNRARGGRIRQPVAFRRPEARRQSSADQPRNPLFPLAFFEAVNPFGGYQALFTKKFKYFF